MPPVISIIVPIFKAEAYLDYCIESILNQTYKDFELILVNDGSPDRCGIICDAYAKRDNRIMVIHKKNGGVSSARNAGLDNAKGEYIGFVDADDYIDQNMYMVLLNYIRQSDADISQCGFIPTYQHRPVNLTKKLTGLQIWSNIEALQSICRGKKDKSINAIVLWNKLYKKKLFDNIRFPEDKIHEDEFTTYKLFYYASKVVVTDLVLYYYFQSNNSIMRSDFHLGRLDYLQALKERREFYKAQKLNFLYEAESINYGLRLISFYYRVRKEFPNNQETAQLLKDDFDKLFIEIQLNKTLPIHVCMLFWFFHITPGLYKPFRGVMKNIARLSIRKRSLMQKTTERQTV